MPDSSVTLEEIYGDLPHVSQMIKQKMVHFATKLKWKLACH